MSEQISIYSVHVRYQQHSFRHVWNWNGPCFFEIVIRKKSNPEKKTLQQLWHSFEKDNDPVPPKGSYLERLLTIWWASTCCIATEDQKRTQLRFTEFLETKRKPCQMRFFLKRNKSEKISPEMWRFLKKTISEQESHQIWWFLKRTKSEKITSNVKVPEKENDWKKIASNMLVLEKNKSEKITTSVKVPDKETVWKEMASNIMVLEKDKSEKQSSHQMWKFLKGKISEKKSHHIW